MRSLRGPVACGEPSCKETARLSGAAQGKSLQQWDQLLEKHAKSGFRLLSTSRQNEQQRAKTLKYIKVASSRGRLILVLENRHVVARLDHNLIDSI